MGAHSFFSAEFARKTPKTCSAAFQWSVHESTKHSRTCSTKAHILSLFIGCAQEETYILAQAHTLAFHWECVRESSREQTCTNRTPLHVRTEALTRRWCRHSNRNFSCMRTHTHTQASRARQTQQKNNTMCACVGAAWFGHPCEPLRSGPPSRSERRADGSPRVAPHFVFALPTISQARKNPPNPLSFLPSFLPSPFFSDAESWRTTWSL